MNDDASNGLRKPTESDFLRDLAADLAECERYGAITLTHLRAAIRRALAAEAAELQVLEVLVGFNHKPDALCPTALEVLHRVGRMTAAEAEVARLQAFKDWVHGYLDAQGVPHHPPGTHGAAGCRIGDRMDWLMARLRAAEAREPQP